MNLIPCFLHEIVRKSINHNGGRRIFLKASHKYASYKSIYRITEAELNYICMMCIIIDHTFLPWLGYSKVLRATPLRFSVASIMVFIKNRNRKVSIRKFLMPYALLRNVLLYWEGIVFTRSRTFLNAPQGILYKICGRIL